MYTDGSVVPAVQGPEVEVVQLIVWPDGAEQLQPDPPPLVGVTPVGRVSVTVTAWLSVEPDESTVGAST
jgi:hypothetical protein